MEKGGKMSPRVTHQLRSYRSEVIDLLQRSANTVGKQLWEEVRGALPLPSPTGTPSTGLCTCVLAWSAVGPEEDQYYMAIPESFAWGELACT